MEELTEYNKRKEIDLVIWSWIPRGFGFWTWLWTTIYLWRIERFGIDFAATIGLGFGAFTWLVFRFVLSLTGSWLIHTNLWENYGCGCLVKVLVFELFQYLAIGLLCLWLFLAGTLTGTNALLCIIFGSINWFLISYLNI